MQADASPFSRGCQTSARQAPVGTPRRVTRPSAPVMAENGVSTTQTYAVIQSWILQPMVTMPGLSKSSGVPA